MAVKNLAQSDPHDARILKAFALGLAVATRGMDHLRNRVTLEINARINDDAAFKRLARWADVVIENLAPGVMDRLGAGYDALRAENPRLIYGSVSGFGQAGPHAKRPAFDTLLQAAGGLISVTGPAGGPPVRVGVSVVDIASGLFLLSGVLGALWRRERTGEGCRLDASMLGAAVNLMENPVARHSFTGEEPRPEGLSHPVVSPFSGYRTRDGLIFVAISNTNRFRVLCQALGRPGLAEDPRFLENKDRLAHDAALREIIEGVLRSRTTAEWEALLIPQGVPVNAINGVAEVKARFPEAFTEVRHPAAGSALLPASPLAFLDAGADFSRPAPRVGEHTEEVLQMLGYAPPEIARLREEGAV